MQPAPPYQPTAMPPQDVQPYGVPPQGPMHGPVPAYMPATVSSYLGPGIAFVGALLVGIGVIITAFSLGGITVGSPQSSGSTISFSASSGAFTTGVVLIGIGIIVRGLGVLMTRRSA